MIFQGASQAPRENTRAAAIPKEVVKAQETITAQAHVQAFKEELEERREQLLLEDPEEYERSIARGELIEETHP